MNNMRYFARVTDSDLTLLDDKGLLQIATLMRSATSQAEVSRETGVAPRTLYNKLQQIKEIIGEKSEGPIIPEDAVPDQEVVEQNVKKVSKDLNRKKSTFVVTWAQNATPVHDGFYRALINYCKVNKATLIVIPGRYKNPTSIWSANNEKNEYWAPEVAPYLMNQRIELNSNLVVMGDIKTQPTAVRPLSGFDTITGDKSGIFGHPKFQLVSVATPQNKLPKLLKTTGAITMQNYTDTNAGKKGEFHHVLGASVVEVCGDEFHMREIMATDDGDFIDLTHEYHPDGTVAPAPQPEALVMGDVHTDLMDPMCERVTFFDKNGIVPTLNPKSIVLHDWYDGYSGSHHHKDKVFIKFAKHHSGRHNVEQELRRTFDRTRGWVESTDATFYVVGSNHNEHLQTWLERGEPKNDPENALFYHRLMADMLERVTMGDIRAEVPDPLQLLVEQEEGLDDLVFLSRDDALIIADIDCSQHGDKGANGSRGSAKQFDAVGVKTITGHGHSPFAEGGAWRTGTNSALRLEYADGLSSWLHTDILIYANGKRTFIHKINGKWRG